MLKGALATLRPVHLKTLALCATDRSGAEDTGVYYHCVGTRAGYEASVDLTRDSVMLRALFMWSDTSDAFVDSVFGARRRFYQDRLGPGRRCAQYHYTWEIADSGHIAVARAGKSASRGDSSWGKVIELLDRRPLPAFLQC
ncbi:MAG TPA: hypothetical protein PKC83_13750 [Gemmatimonadaceae bacterium]|jgi:hypothetical protein|nr:MAG: hypothetical protein ABS52_01455 [Gemmatimonadetes bacterium SCN 70-22]HMN09840.1 hypothetical protein [Gemmatimonadaceae bacterium]